jgi:hypothetical protein
VAGSILILNPYGQLGNGKAKSGLSLGLAILFRRKDNIADFLRLLSD